MKKLFFLLVMAVFAVQAFAQTPLNEGFEGTTFPPENWTSVNVSGAVSWEGVDYFYNTGSACAAISYDWDGDAENWLITPKLSVESTSDSIIFYVTTDSWYANTTLNVRISTTDNQTSSFNETALLSLTSATDVPELTWARYAIGLSAYVNQEVYIAFQVVDDNGMNILLDDVQGPNIVLPSCLAPTNLTATNPTINSIDLSWVSDATSWNIEYMLSSETDWESATAVNATTNPYTLSTLSSSSTYKIRIQADCGSDLSEWTTPITFATLCESVTIPYSEGFDLAIGAFPNCWARPVYYTNYSGTIYPSVSTTSSRIHSGTGSLEIRSSNATTPSYVVTPSIATDIETLRVTFWAMAESATSSGNLEVGVMSDANDITTFESVEIITPTSTAYTQYEILFNNVSTTGENKYIAFRHTNSNSWYYWIDDLTIDLLPSCFRPTAVAASNLTATSADISFVSDATSWNIQYMLASETDWETATSDVATSSPYSITELTANTSYKVRMQSICGSETSEWISPITFTTPCAVLSVPTLVETFEAVPPSACWTKKGGALPLSGNATLTGNGSWGSSTREIYTGAGSNVRMNIWSTVNGWLISPSIDLGTDGTTYQVEMDVLISAYGNDNAPATNGTDDVFGIVISTDNGVTWNRENAILWTNEEGATRVYNNLYPMQHLSIPLEDASGNPYQGIVKIGIYAGSTTANADNDIRFDNFIVRGIPNCLTPSNLVATNITTTSADISFTSDATSWNIEYMLASETDWESATAVNATTSNPYSITELLPSSTYKVRVQAICGSDLSEWTSTMQFQTSCEAVNVPWTQNFDASTSLPMCCSLVQGIPSISTTQTYSSPNSLQLSNGAWVVTPQIVEDINLLRVKFMARSENIYSSGTLEIGIMSDPTDVTTFESVSIISPDPSATWIEHEIMFNGTTLTGGNKYVAFRQNNTTNYWWWVDDILVDYVPSCTSPTAVAVSNITTTSADVTITDEENTSWNVEYMLSSETDWANAQTLVATTSTFTLTGLSSSSTYKIRVQASCNSDWTTTINFSTSCDAITTFPYIIDFEAAEQSAMPDCWIRPDYTYTSTTLITTTYPYVYSSTSGAHQGSKCLFFMGTTYNFGVTPPMGVELNTLLMKFWAKTASSSYANTMYIGVMSDPTDSSTFELVSTIILSETTWQEYEIMFNDIALTGTNKYIVFKYQGQGSYASSYVDDVTIELLPSCVKPTNISFNNYTSSSIDIAWENISGATSWNIQYMVASQTDWTTASEDIITTNPYNLTSLAPNTQYKVRLQSICDDGLSEWSDEVSFQTTCESVEIPYTENFDRAAASFPECWRRPIIYNNSLYGTFPQVTIVASELHLGTGALEIRSSANNPSYAVTPPISLDIETLSLKFWAKAENINSSGAGTLEVGIMSNPHDITTFESVLLITPTNTEYTEYEILLNNVTTIGENRYIAFRQNTTSTTYSYFVDDVTIDFLPTCLRPIDVVVSNPTTSSVDIAWVSDASTWNLEYMEATQTDWANATPIVVTSNPYTLENLTENTQYKFRLQTDCGGETSDWTSEYTFSTSCLSVDVPYTEGFDLSTAAFPNCWRRPVTYTYSNVIYPSVSTTLSRIHSGTGSLELRASSATNPSYAVTPPIAEDIETLMVTFWAMAENATSSGTLEVGVMSDANDITTFESVSVITPTASGTYTKYEVVLSDITLTGTENYVAFRHNTASEYYYYWIDDVTIDYIPSCTTPTELAASNLTATSADISFTSNATSWNLQYMQTYQTSWDSATTISITENPYTLTNLLPSTFYKARLKAFCGDEESDWTNPITFNTSCQAISSFPYVQGFEDATSGEMPLCWSKLPANADFPTVNASNAARTGNQYLGFFLSYGYAVSPQITADIHLLQMNLWIQNSVREFVIGVMSNPADTTTFEAVYTAPINDNYTQHYISFANTSTVTGENNYIAIKFLGSGFNQGMVDDITIDYLPPCTQPTSLAISNATTTSVDLSWADESGSSWNIQYMLASETDWTNAQTINTTLNPYTIMQLTAATEYQVRMQTDCGGEQSGWTNPVLFTTACESIVVPYTESFNLAEESFPICWSRPIIHTDGYGTFPSVSLSNTHTGTGSMEIHSSTTTPTYVISPAIAADIETLRVILWAKSENINASGTLEVGVMSDPTDLTTFESVRIINPTNTDYNQYEILLYAVNTTGADKHIAFRQNTTNPNYFWWIDDVTIESIPACTPPVNLSISNATTTTADLSWVDPILIPASWNVEYMPADSTSWDNATAEEVTAMPFTMTQLVGSSTYKVRIQSNCSEEVSEWSDVFSFTTPCYDGAISVFPWEEGFENGFTCWGQENIVGSVNWGMNEPHYADSALSDNFASFFSNTIGTTTRLITPPLNLTLITTPTLEFYHVQEIWGSDQDTLRIYYRTSETASWTQFVEYTNSIVSWTKDTIVLPNPSSTYQLAFEAIADWGHGIGLDNVKVYDASATSCLPPTGFVATASSTVVALSWEASQEETAWQIKLGVSGDEIDITAMPFYITGLTPNTTYTVYLRANCGDGYSSWTSVDFTTTENPPMVSTLDPTLISQFSATLNGEYANVASAVQSKGFEYKISDAADWTVAFATEGTEEYYLTLNDLEANTEYTYKAFITTATETIYGEEVSFNTLAIVAPIVVTDSIENLTATSVTLIGEVTQGTLDISARGFELKTSELSWEEAQQYSATGTSPFTYNVTTLVANENYVVRAYVKTGELGEDIFYGNEVYFATTNGLMDEINGSISISMYPNPAEKETKLIIDGIYGKVDVTLSDVQGRRIDKFTIKAQGKIEHNINVSNLAKGTYYIRLQNEKLNRTHKLIVK